MDRETTGCQGKNMRILMLTSTLPRFPGDMQANFVGEQAAAWAGARCNDEICVLAPHDADAARRETVGRVQVERFRYFAPAAAQRLAYPAILPNLRRNPFLWAQVPLFLLAEYRAAKRTALRIGADLVYAHWVIPQGVVAWRLKRKLGIPYILQNHSSDLAVFERAGSAGKWLARSVLREAAHFFCVNARQRDDALALLTPGERDDFARRCTVLPMGMVLPPSLQQGEAAGRRYDIATIGRLSSKKGLDLLILAAERLADRGLRPSIGIAGDGEERSRLEALVSNSDVTFAGFLTGVEKDRFLATADRFAFPALATGGDVEGLPVALLEVLARGTPVLASRDTNIELLPEWPQIRDAVVLVDDPADIPALEGALEKLLTIDPGPMERVARIVGRYRWDTLICDYIAAVEAAVRR